MSETLAWRAPTDAGVPTTMQIALLVACLGTALIPHAGVLPGWVMAGAALGGAWRLGAALGWWGMPGRVLRVLLTFGAVFAVTFSYRRIDGLEAGSALLVTMMALKLLETQSRRDRGIVVFIAWFVLFAGFLREQSVLSVPQLVAGVLAGLLALLEGMRQPPLTPPAEALRTVLGLGARALPLALVLFLLFPRLPQPFWALPTGGSESRSGLSDVMNPGDVSRLVLSDEVAFRVRFLGEEPPASDLYWRGPVLEQFDGRSWRRVPRLPIEATPVPAPGTGRYEYEIILEPHDQNWLLPLETPLHWDLAGARLTPTTELITETLVDRRLAYRAVSVSGSVRHGQTIPGRQQTSLPPGHPRTREFARELRARVGTDAEFALEVLRHFREQPFRYTLEPPALGPDPVDDFLFRTRAGFCEHYASAFAVLARAAGIPARVIGGYQGGERNPLADYWIVRQSDAHAWTELWLDGRWVRFDPTGAVAPERIESGFDAALPASERGELPLIGGSEFLSRLSLSWDALNATWDRWVLAFGPDRQADLLRNLGFEAPTIREVALACAVAVALVLLALTVVSLRRPRPPRDPLHVAWERLCRKLAPAARPRRPAEGPSEYAAEVARLRPDLAAEVLRLAERYVRLRYESPATARDVSAFSAEVRRFRPARRAPAPA